MGLALFLGCKKEHFPSPEAWREAANRINSSVVFDEEFHVDKVFQVEGANCTILGEHTDFAISIGDPSDYQFARNNSSFDTVVVLRHSSPIEQLVAVCIAGIALGELTGGQLFDVYGNPLSASDAVDIANRGLEQFSLEVKHADGGSTLDDWESGIRSNDSRYSRNELMRTHSNTYRELYRKLDCGLYAVQSLAIQKDKKRTVPGAGLLFSLRNFQTDCYSPLGAKSRFGICDSVGRQAFSEMLDSKVELEFSERDVSGMVKAAAAADAELLPLYLERLKGDSESILQFFQVAKELVDDISLEHVSGASNPKAVEELKQFVWNRGLGFMPPEWKFGKKLPSSDLTSLCSILAQCNSLVVEPTQLPDWLKFFNGCTALRIGHIASSDADKKHPRDFQEVVLNWKKSTTPKQRLQAVAIRHLVEIIDVQDELPQIIQTASQLSKS